MASLQETLDNANAIMTGEKEIKVGLENQSFIILAVVLVMSFVIIFGVAKLIKPFKN